MDVDIDQNHNEKQSHECQRNDLVYELNVICVVLIVKISKSNNEASNKNDDSLCVNLLSNWFQIKQTLFNHHNDKES